MERYPVLVDATERPPILMRANGNAGPIEAPKRHRVGAGVSHAVSAATGQKLLEAWERHEEHLQERQLFFE
jgi:hypothetical protein